MEPRVSNGTAEAGDRNCPYIKSGNRREYKDWFKAQVVEECHAPGASVSIVARRHDINANVLFRWRREYQLGILKPTPRPNQADGFVAVGVIGEDGKVVAPAPAKPALAPPAKAKPPAAPAVNPSPPPVPTRPAAPAGVVELHLANRIKIRIQGDVNKEALRGVLAIAREFA